MLRQHNARIDSYPLMGSISKESLCGHGLQVRSWVPGDKYLPLGVDGHKKIQDIFTDQKVPKDIRHACPLIVCGDTIVWLPGYQVAKGWELADDKAASLQITIKKTSANAPTDEAIEF